MFISLIHTPGISWIIYGISEYDKNMQVKQYEKFVKITYVKKKII